MDAHDGQTVIRFGGHAVADRLLFEGWPTHLVSIQTPGQTHLVPPRWFRGNLLELTFRDTRDPQDPGAPGVLVVHRIIEFAKTADLGSQVMVACPAGYSRSAAVAVVLSVALGTAPTTAFDQMGTEHPQASPNPVLIRSADIHLGLDGDLIAAWRAWLISVGLDESWFDPVRVRGRR